jgi:predicted HTH transcriptional regulator
MKRAFDTMNRGNQASGELSERQQSIIKELRNKGQLTVKDLAEKIRGCSEKTIQRELLSLVGSGVLKKEGERRWSRYSIK